MTADPFFEIPRDRFGRPLIKQVDGSKPVPYTRATTVAKAVEDQSNLMKWKQRQTLLGLIVRPDLALAASAAKNISDEKAQKKQLNDITEQCMEASESSASATKGTALHSLCETVDRGGVLEHVPADFAADIEAYRKETAGLRHRHIETMLVNDELKIAGTPDRISSYMSRMYIADIKSGSIAFPHSIAAQLAIYANSSLYDFETGERTPLAGVDKKRGIVIHLPAGTGTCSLHWVDIAAGWKAVQLAVAVREWRSTKALMQPLVRPTADVLALIGKASTVTDLEALWLTHSEVWTPAMTEAAAARKASLATAAA